MKNEIKSLNKKLFSEVSIEELEERLEMGCWSKEGTCTAEVCGCEGGQICGCNGVEVCFGVEVCTDNNPCGEQGGE